MINPYFFESDLSWHTEKVLKDYAAAQRPVSFHNVRAAMGHSLIRIGTAIQGKAREVCEGCPQPGVTLAHPTR